MSSSLKIGSSWKQITGVSTKVLGDWKQVTAAYTKVAGVWKQWYAPAIVDNFNRSTSGGLGTSTSGASWSNLRQSWYANGSSAQSDASASSYALATVGFGSVNLVASAGVTNGTGLGFWIQDADNWYAAYAFQTTTSSSYLCGYTSCPPCTTNTTYYTPSYSSCTCNPGDSGGGVNTYATSSTYACPTGNCSSSSCDSYMATLFSGCGPGYTEAKTLPGSPCGTATAPTNYTYCYKITTTYSNSSFCYGSSSSTSGPCCCGATVVGSTYVVTSGTPGTCNQCTNTTQSCSSCPVYCPTTTNSWALRLIKMTAGSISIAAPDVALSGTPAAIRVSTSVGLIEVQAFSDSALTTQMGSTLSHTPASSGPGQYVGVIKAPSDAQGSTIDNLVITL